MSTTKNAPLRGLVAHASAFALAVLVGAVATLGVRSLFLAPEAARPMGAATPARGHHAGPGHEGHAHAQSALGGDDRTGPERSPSTTDPHARHGHDDPARATTGPEEAEATTVERGAVPGHVGVLLDLGNSACPVMGGDTDGATYTEWNGLRIGHCCPGCDERFLANPEALLDEVSPNWREAAQAAAAIDAAEGAERERLLGRADEAWGVVREPSGPARRAPGGLLVDLGNTTCPVMGGEPDGKSWSEWNGLRIGHCCPGCTKRFLANPEALLDEVAPRWRDAAAAVARVKKAEGAARTEALASLRGDWSVVREPVDETVK